MSNKTISINPSLFGMNSRLKTRRAEKKMKPTNVPLISPSVLKNKLLHRIKEHKKRETSNLDKVNRNTNNSNSNSNNNPNDLDIDNFNDEFNNSIQYLQTLSKQKKINDEKENYEKQRQQKREELEKMTIKNYHSLNSNSYVNIDLPEELQEQLPIKVSPNEESINLKYNIDNNIPYGVLKNGVKPTYRDWTRKQRDMEVTNSNSSLVIHGGNINRQTNNRENRLQHLREKIKLKSVMDSLQNENKNE